MPSKDRSDPRHRPYGKGMRKGPGAAAKGTRHQGRRLKIKIRTGSTVSTPQSIARAQERDRLSAFFNSLVKGTFVKVVRNKGTGHHDITNRRPELQDAVCEVVRTAVYPGTWLTIKPRGGGQSSHFKVRSSQIQTAEPGIPPTSKSAPANTGASRKRQRQSSIRVAAQPTKTLPKMSPKTTRNAGADGDSSDSAGSSSGASRCVMRRCSADPSADRDGATVVVGMEIDPPAPVVDRLGAELARQQEAALLASAHRRLRIARWAGGFFRGLWAILGSRFAFAPVDGHAIRVIKTASPWEQIDILHREAAAHVLLRAEQHSGPLEVVADLRELFRRHHRKLPETVSSAQLARVGQAESWLDERLWHWSPQGPTNVPSPSTAWTPPPRSKMMLEMSRRYVDVASPGQLEISQQLELLTASLFDGSDDGDMLAADRRLIAAIANNLAAEIGPL